MKKGRVTIPTNLDVVPQTLEILDEWGADAIRDCDGTEFPKELKDTGSKIYATYYTTRKDNEWAKAHPEEIQQMYIMTSFHTATEDKLEIHLMDHLYPDMLAVNTRDDIYRWWEVIDRTTGEPVSTELWSYDEETGNVVIRSAKLFHVVRFSIRSVYCQKQICDFPSKRCLTIYRRFADKSVQKYLVHRNGFILFLNEFQFPGKYRKHQAVMLFLMSVIGTELSVDLHVFPYVILCHIHQTFRYHHWYSVF